MRSCIVIGILSEFGTLYLWLYQNRQDPILFDNAVYPPLTWFKRHQKRRLFLKDRQRFLLNRVFHPE